MSEQTCVKPSPCAGNGLFASKAIPAGNLILSIPQPLVAVLDTPRLADSCSNCFRWTARSAIGSRGPDAPGLQTCGGCKRVKFCNKSCQSQAWKRFHKYECKVLGGARDVLPNVVRATLQIFLRKAAGSISDPVWESLMRLESHFADYEKSSSGTPNDRWGDCSMMAAGVSYFCGWEVETDAALDMLLRLMINCLTLVTPTFDPLGLVCDPLAALANHSCDPNAVVVMDGPAVSFRSLKDISKDDEIFISYTDATMPRMSRWTELYSKYFFSCECSKCMLGTNTREDAFELSANDLSPKWRSKAEAIVADHMITDDPYTPFDDEQFLPLRLSALEHLAKKAHAKARQASGTDAVQQLTQCLTDQHDMGIFAAARQPHASTRHDLFIQLLSTGDFVKAFKHGVKAYFLIDPVQLPQAHHPVRVVHTWTLAVLALYLAHEPDAPGVREMQSRGLDLAVVAHRLLLEVLSAVDKSHGANSGFAQMVKSRVREAQLYLAAEDPKALETIKDRIQQQQEIFKQASGWVQI